MALTKVFDELIYLPFLISLIFILFPASIYYGKLLEVAVFGVPFALITFALFIFYLYHKHSFYLWLFLLSILIGCLTNWFYYFLPISIWVYVILFKNEFSKSQRNNLIALIPLFVFTIFSLNIFHFYILKGSFFLRTLKKLILKEQKYFYLNLGFIIFSID